LVGVVEGLITLAVLGYLQQVRGDMIAGALAGRVRLSKKAVLITLVVFSIVIGAGLSLLACGLPDGLEWSYAERPDQPDFKTAISNEDSRIAAVDDFQDRYSPLPDYSVRTSTAAGWTSFAGVVGSGLTMAFIWLIASILRKKQPAEVV
jgi:cobalt/nickel transport system permease protein